MNTDEKVLEWNQYPGIEDGPDREGKYDQFCLEEEAEQALLGAIPPVRAGGTRFGRPHYACELLGRCEACSENRVLYSQLCYTLGFEGHPGAELTDFHICRQCLEGE